MVLKPKRIRKSTEMEGNEMAKKHYGYCGIVRQRDFEDRHPIIAGVIVLAAFVIAMSIAMVIL